MARTPGIGPHLARAGTFTVGAVAASSASALVFEISLTRVFAVSQFYHFAFLVVSLALLGIGASGTLLSVIPSLGAGGPRRWAVLAGLQAVAVLAASTVANRLPFDSFAIAWDRRQALLLGIIYVALGIPFLMSGLIVAVLLVDADRCAAVPSHAVYAASLVGSAFGCVIAVGGIDAWGAEGLIVVSSLGALGAAAGFAALTRRRASSLVAVAVAATAVIAVTALAPTLLDLRLSPYKALSAALRYPGAEIVATDWDAGTRIDLVRSDGLRSVPGLSLASSVVPPPQDGLTFDGDDISPLATASAEESVIARRVLTALPWLVRPGAEGLVLGPRGGLEVLVALTGGADGVVAVEPHGTVIGAMAGEGASLYDDPRVTVVAEEPRSYVERTSRRFDVVDVALTAPYRPVTSGAYSLVEDYGTTVEAFTAYLDRLEPGGVLAVARWVQTPPSEEIRLLGVAAEAVHLRDGDPESSTVMLRSYANALVLVRPDGWPADDLAAVRAFADDLLFDIVALPGPDDYDPNRHNAVPGEAYSTLARVILDADHPAAALGAYEFDVTPPTDDHPFFDHYFTWNQARSVIDSLGRSWQPFGGAGFFILVAFFALTALSASVLIVAPLALRRRSPMVAQAPAALRRWAVAYFGLLGLGFLLVEIPLIQQYILLVGSPTSAFAVVLFALLVGSGTGSALSPRIPWAAGAVTLAILAAATPPLVRSLTEVALSAPLVIRMTVGAVAILPIGFLMGIMLPAGIRHLEARAPGLVAWAWGINGAASVVSAAAAALLSLLFGFAAVLRTGATAYALAAVMAVGAVRSLSVAGEGNEEDAAEALS